MESGMVRHALPEGERGHDLGGGLAHERGDGNDRVAVGAQRVDQRPAARRLWRSGRRRRRA